MWECTPKPQLCKTGPGFLYACLNGTRLSFAGIAVRFHVGDTPMDLQAADGAGARGVGVTTGIYSHDELAAASPGGSVVMLPLTR